MNAAGSLLNQVRMLKALKNAVSQISFFPSFIPYSFHSFSFLYALNIPCKLGFSFFAPTSSTAYGFHEAEPGRGRGGAERAWATLTASDGKEGGATGNGRGPGHLDWS